MKTLKINTLPLPLSALAAASVIFLCTARQAEAGVVWLASDDGTNLTLTTDGGSLSTVGSAGFSPNTNTVGHYFENSNIVWNLNGTYYSEPLGFSTGQDPWISGTTTATIATGDAFGHYDSRLLWDVGFGSTPGTFTPNASLTFAGLTVATAFGSNLDSGPVVLWVASGTDDTISVAKVPEPSSAALLGLGALGLVLRRRRA